MWVPPLWCAAALAASSLRFDGQDDHVAMGVADGLGLPEFTVECWFRWEGASSGTFGTGSGGLDLYPLVTKGRGESDGGTQDMAWGLGVDPDSGVLCADFEDLADGTNHPVCATTDVRDGAWHHAAATYDGAAWALYLDGQLDGAADTGGATPRHDSVQHLAVATAMDTVGEPSGRFFGAVDEVRIWDRARGEGGVQESMNTDVTHAEGLVARWGFDEGTGDVAADDVGGVTGAVVGASWAEQAPFDADLPPYAPILRVPVDGAEGVSLDPALRVRVNDPDGGPLTARFRGRRMPGVEPDFTFVMLPDSQYYCSGGQDGEAGMFSAQTAWVVAEREARNIVWVAHVGDIVDDGDSEPEQWLVADAAMALLEDPDTTGLPDGVPYSMAVGNHDQTPNGDPLGTTDNYNATFGAARFADRSWYGGHHGDDHDDHFELFSAGSLGFIAISLEYDQGGVDQGALAWADALLAEHADRLAIVNAHHLLETDGSFSEQGALVYAALGHHGNLFLMLCGHLTAEAWRADPAGADGTVHTLMADYQFTGGGGNGWLRILTFSPADGTLQVETYSPWLDMSDGGADSEFVLPWAVPEAAWQELGEREVTAGDEVEVIWAGLDPWTDHEWMVSVSDGVLGSDGPVWTFTTGDGERADSAVADSGTGARRPTGGCGCGGVGASALGMLAGLLALAGRRRRGR